MTRRDALVVGSVGVGGLMVAGAGNLAVDVPAADAALPSTTAPEQLRLEWGSDPATEMTVSWSAPGTLPMPAPVLAYSTSPITPENPGALVFLPQPEPLDLTQGARTGPCATSFTDGQTAQTTYHYHVPLAGLEPDTTYYYEVADGAGGTAGASFQTAPSGRASFRFTAFGDQGVNAPISQYTTSGVANPGDGNGAPLFHLMVGDLAYADGSNPPSTWRSWALQVESATQNFPWMPVMGNHEVEPGATDVSGVPQTTGTSGGFYNGPYGSGSFFSRFLLPDNGVTNWDGNSLQGSFHSFQVGTVLFIGLAGNDVNWQTSDYSHTKPAQYTGELAADASNMALIPSGTTPNLQTQWLEQTLQAARAEGSGVEMIVVQMHFPFASVDTGNSCDMGVRTAWGPLFDKYQVDLTLTGHNHNYCRSLPTRGYDAAAGVTSGAITNPFGSYASGATIDTRRPTVTQAEPLTIDGRQTFDTSLGTVHLVVGGGGAASTIGDTVDATTGLTQAHPFADPANNAQAVEDAPWLGFYDTANAYGYGVFDVDPGDGPGQTTITFQWFSVSTTDPAPAAPLEKFVFARMDGRIAAGVPAIEGTVSVGRTVTADPGNWSPAAADLSYQWLRAGTPISGAQADSYTITAADLGQELQVQVSGALEGFATTTATSSGALVAGGLLQPSVVTISGSVEVGGMVTADALPWTPAATLAYQWLLDGAAIAGATGTRYSPASGDAGHVLELQVTGSADGFQSASARSVPQTVARGATSGQPDLALPTLSAKPTVGSAVSARLARGSAAAAVSYQWLVDGSAIRGAGGASYTPVPHDAGRRLQVKLSTNGQAVISRAATVAAVQFRTASRPGLHGTAAAGHTLKAVVGRWSPTPTLEYQWLLDGKPIRGATRPIIAVVGAYVDRRISLRVTARRSGYVTRETVSDAVVIRRGSISGPAPRIRGDARVGETLHVIRGDWEPQPEFSYRWLVNGRPVEGRSTGIAYKVRPQDRGKRISVEVTGRSHGYASTARASASTPRVRA
ncbi:MAG TPA: fibronectin type III domain-containing protein [Solirubrobacteraceae bacterium]|nr:fibronectin type III domain-containing protein [Solirubrobacteraceae bacterium]